MSEDDTNGVSRLPVKFKAPTPEARTLLRPWEVGRPSPCNHLMAGFIVDESAAEVECGRCGAKLNPMWVLTHLATSDRRFEEAQKRYQEEQQRLAERSRTKCDHCGKMTRISRR